ncbi:hypothetical protein HAX54_005351, partial [Datura stramonium]|nr:hypothetical protein [Datura stramonium]
GAFSGEIQSTIPGKKCQDNHPPVPAKSKGNSILNYAEMKGKFKLHPVAASTSTPNPNHSPSLFETSLSEARLFVLPTTTIGDQHQFMDTTCYNDADAAAITGGNTDPTPYGSNPLTIEHGACTRQQFRRAR